MLSGMQQEAENQRLVVLQGATSGALPTCCSWGGAGDRWWPAALRQVPMYLLAQLLPEGGEGGLQQPPRLQPDTGIDMTATRTHH